jgi:hypothetical protein
MQKRNKVILSVVGIILAFLVFIVAASIYSMNTPTASERKQAEFMHKIPIPSYMTADFSELERGCDFKCGNPIDVGYSYGDSVAYAKALRDFAASLKSIGYTQGKSTVDTSVGLSHYEFLNSDTENYCEQVLVEQYHDLHYLKAACYLEKVNVAY